MCRDVIDSHRDQSLSPIQRIRKIWYTLFLIRIWRHFIVTHKNYKLKDNFLTSNCYSCIEINAHSLVLCILHLQSIKKPELFLPHLYESQPCEAIFRQFRSLTSVNSTVVNCTVKEAISRISKIHLQNEIIEKTSSQFIYPRLKQFSDKQNRDIFELPSKEEIIREIEFCQKTAISTATKFGLISNKHSSTTNYVCKVNPFTPKQQAEKSHKYTPIKNIQILQPKDLKNIELKDWSQKVKQNVIDNSSIYTEIRCSNKKTIVVKKSSLCWLLNPDQKKLSSDRLIRVRFSERNRLPKKQTRKENKVSFCPYSKHAKKNKKYLYK